MVRFLQGVVTAMLERAKRIARTVARLDVDSIRYALWLRRHRLDFAPESCESLGIPEWTAPHAMSGGPDVVKVLDELRIPPGSRCIDFGSGKGIACLTLRRYFHRVTGVELSQRLVDIARENVAKLGVDGVDFVCADAADVTDLDDFTHVYLFNPFPDVVMRQVAANLKASIQRKPRNVPVIYRHPFCADTLKSEGFAVRCVFKPPAGHTIAVYEHRC